MRGVRGRAKGSEGRRGPGCTSRFAAPETERVRSCIRNGRLIQGLPGCPGGKAGGLRRCVPSTAWTLSSGWQRTSLKALVRTRLPAASGCWGSSACTWRMPIG
eukprot:5061028-Alexandrium_andersonii.AAC.1